MIAALADAGAVLAREDYVEAARACASFVLDELRDDEGNLLRTWKDGQASLPAYLEDHAYLLQALLVLYEATFEERWYVEAVALADAMIERFGDRERGGFFTTAADAPLPGHAAARTWRTRRSPSGNSAAALGPAAPGAAVRRRRLRAAGRRRARAARRRSRSAIRSPSANCCRRSTSTWRRPARWRSLAPVRWPAPSAPGTGPTSCWPGPTADSTEGSAVALLRDRSASTAAGRLRVRALRLPAAGHRAGGAGGAALDA